MTKKELLQKINENMATFGEQLIDMQKQINEIKRDMRSQIDERVIAEIGDKINMIDGALTETILQKQILIAKGMITREEINAKYDELKRASNG